MSTIFTLSSPLSPLTYEGQVKSTISTEPVSIQPKSVGLRQLRAKVSLVAWQALVKLVELITWPFRAVCNWFIGHKINVVKSEVGLSESSSSLTHSSQVKQNPASSTSSAAIVVEAKTAPPLEPESAPEAALATTPAAANAAEMEATSTVAGTLAAANAAETAETSGLATLPASATGTEIAATSAVAGTPAAANAAEMDVTYALATLPGFAAEMAGGSGIGFESLPAAAVAAAMAAASPTKPIVSMSERARVESKARAFSLALLPTKTTPKLKKRADVYKVPTYFQRAKPMTEAELFIREVLAYESRQASVLAPSFSAESSLPVVHSSSLAARHDLIDAKRDLDRRPLYRMPRSNHTFSHGQSFVLSADVLALIKNYNQRLQLAGLPRLIDQAEGELAEPKSV